MPLTPPVPIRRQPSTRGTASPTRTMPAWAERAAQLLSEHACANDLRHLLGKWIRQARVAPQERYEFLRLAQYVPERQRTPACWQHWIDAERTDDLGPPGAVYLVHQNHVPVSEIDLSAPDGCGLDVWRLRQRDEWRL